MVLSSAHKGFTAKPQLFPNFSKHIAVYELLSKDIYARKSFGFPKLEEEDIGHSLHKYLVLIHIGGMLEIN